MGIFSIDSPLMRALNLIADLLILHFLWLLCSIPIVTIGASTTALYYACMKRISTKEGYVSRNFFHSFRSNFRQATVIWLVLAAIGCMFHLDFQIAHSIGGTLGTFMNVGCAIFLIPYFCILLYIFPVLAKFENTVRDNIKNAFLMSFRHFPLTLVLVLIDGSFLLLSMFFVPMMGLLLICGAGVIGYMTSMIYIQIFRRYIPGELEKDVEISGETFDLHTQY